MKKTDVLAAAMSSSTCGRSVRFAFGVKRLALVLAQPMRLVEDEDVDVVRIGVAELVEVAELRLAGAVADDAAHVLGEGLAAGGVHGVVAALGELADEVERDDRLAGARPALDEDDRLLRVVVAVAGLGQDRFERDALLVEQHELAVAP